MKAPLLIGCDLTNIDNESLRILTNKELIAVNQDKLGIQGNKRKSDGTLEVWAGPLDGGAYAVVLLNRGTTTANVTAEWTDFGLDSNREASVRDLWKMQDLGTMKGSVSATVVQPRSCHVQDNSLLLKFACIAFKIFLDCIVVTYNNSVGYGLS